MGCPSQPAPRDPDSLRSLRELFDELDTPHKGPAYRHPPESTPSLNLLAKLNNFHGGRGVESFCKSLPQNELEALGCHFDRCAKVYRPLSDTTFQRVLATVDPQSLKQVLERWIRPRSKPATALAGDGKRICRAYRLSAEGEHGETVTLVDHCSGQPLVSRSCREEGGEPAAMRALFEELPLAGTTVTLDAGHTSRQSLRALRAQLHTRTYWAGSRAIARRPWPRSPGWIGKARRCAATASLGPQGAASGASVRWKWWRWRRTGCRSRRCSRSSGSSTARSRRPKIDLHYGFTSLPAERASAWRLLTLHRGHWAVENGNQLSREVSLGEDETAGSARGTGRPTTVR